MFNKRIYNLSLLYIFLCICLHIISCYFSIGFYSDDEHFQILEPAAYLLGINDMVVEDTTGYYWEWRSHIRMRPWLQPYIYYNFILFFKYLGFINPFQWIFIIKLISSFFGLSSIIYLFFTFKNNFFKKNNHFNFFIFFSFWFYPFLHSRTSSENLSITLFIFSFCFLYKQLESKEMKFNYFLLFIASFIMGLSMVTKFNMIFTTIPFFIWMAIFYFNIYRLTFFSISILLALSFGLLIDYINWGTFKNTYYQFYYYNLDSKFGRLNDYGEQPWWYFVFETAIQLAPILSFIFIIGIIVYWVKNPKNSITWITFMTILFISIFKHKEIRYIFPVYIFAPLFVAYFFEIFNIRYLTKILKFVVVLSNIIFLIITLFFPANNKVGVYEFIYKNISKNSDIYYIENNPYLVNNMEPFIYTKFLPEIKKFEIETNTKNTWLISNRYDLVDTLPNNCLLKYSTYPENIFKLNPNWRRLKLNWYILKCN